MGDEKKTPLEDLLKSLEGHVVDSVEIRGEPIRVCEGNEGDILHVRISATELDPKYLEHVRLNPKDLSLSILEADFLDRILDYFLERAREIALKFDIDLGDLGDDEKKEVSVTQDLTLSLPDVRKLLAFIKGTITESLRIRKRIEKTDD